MTEAETNASDPSPDSLSELSNWRPYSQYPLISKETLHAGDPARNLYPVRRLTFRYTAGKTLPIRFATDVIKVVHATTGRAKSYSPTSDPARVGAFDLVVKIYPGDGVSAYLDTVPLNGRVTMYGPHPPAIARPLFRPGARTIALALGIGVTHALTTVRDVLKAAPDARVTLVVGVQYAEQGVVLADEIEALERTYADRFDVVRVASREDVEGWHHGRIDSGLVGKLVGDADHGDVRVMVVGTKAMIKAVWADLGNIGFTYEEHALVKKLSPFSMVYNAVFGVPDE